MSDKDGEGCIGRAFLFGHAIYLTNKFEDGYFDWRYVDTNKSIHDEDGVCRRCPQCNKLPTKDGHDPCMANLPGVEFACCGHGVEDGYVKFEDGRVIRGAFTIQWPVSDE